MPTNSKEYMNKYMKIYHDVNKEKLHQKVECDICHCQVSKSWLSAHSKSPKHIKNVNAPPSTDDLLKKIAALEQKNAQIIELLK